MRLALLAQQNATLRGNARMTPALPPHPRRHWAATHGPLRVAVVGCGDIAPRHAEAYADTGRTDLVGVVDIDLDRARQFAEKFGSTPYDQRRGAARRAEPRPGLGRHPARHARRDRDRGPGSGTHRCCWRSRRASRLADLDASPRPSATAPARSTWIFQHRHGSGCASGERLLNSGALGVPQVAVCETLWFRPASYFDPDWRGHVGR